MRYLILLLLLFTGFTSYGQTHEEILLSKEDPYNLYRSWDKDSTTLFYRLLIPKGKPLGVLVILPGAGEPLDDAEQQITLHKLAVAKGMLVIFPSINWGTTKHIPEHEMLDKIFSQVIQRFDVPKDKFVLGGFSGGAMLALTYAEKANREKGSTVIVPKAIFGVDPPLDYAHLWRHCINDIERNFSDVAVAEARWITEMYTEEFGGSPEDFTENYIRYSIYSHSEKDGGNAKYLLKTPILLYTEPDVVWSMKNRHRDFYDLNAPDISAMINLLQLGGNNNAELIVTHDKGYRLDGTRHPHSWSIMDSEECLDWILRQLGN
jgi:pimeloyl-ACP methyl ester carboxylesterase